MIAIVRQPHAEPVHTMVWPTLQLTESSTASPVSPFGPVDPVEPAGPVAPVGPMGPVEPVGPAGPVAPVAPFDPAGPCAPVAPFSPAMFQVTFLCPRGQLPESDLSFITLSEPTHADNVVIVLVLAADTNAPTKIAERMIPNTVPSAPDFMLLFIAQPLIDTRDADVNGLAPLHHVHIVNTDLGSRFDDDGSI